MYKLTLVLIAISLFITTGNALFGLFEDQPQFLIIETVEEGARLYTGISPITVDNDSNQIGLNVLSTSDWNGLFDGFQGIDLNRTVLARCSGDSNSVWTSANICQSIAGFDTGGGITDLNISELGDVTISSLINDQILVFNSSTLQWENQNLDVNVLFVSTGFLTDFNSSDVNATGILSIQHDSNRQYPTVTIYDSNELILLPDDVVFIDVDNIDVNLLSQSVIVGTWHVRVEAGEAQDGNTLFIRLDGGNDQSITGQIQFPVSVFFPNTQSVSFSDSDLNISSTGDGVLNISSDANVVIDANVIINDSSGHGSLQLNGVAGGCLKIEDTDASGFTFCTTLNGVLSCSTTPC